MGKALNVAATALAVVAVAVAAILVLGRPFGFHAYSVLSGSMEPEYSTGSLIYVKKADASALGEGDVITFMVSEDATATHRIVAEVEGADGVTLFQTQGDANQQPDAGLVHPDNVIGTPVLEVPFLGYLVNFVQHPPGTYLAVSFCAIIVALMFLPDLFAKDEDEDEGKARTRSGAAGRNMTAPPLQGSTVFHLRIEAL